MEKNTEKSWVPDEYSPLFIENIKDVLQKVYNQFRAVNVRLEYLVEENERLKSDAYKDEELAEMKEKLDKMQADYYRGFQISEKEDKKIKEWEEKMMAGDPDLKINSTRFHYEFYPTGLGVSGYVVDDITGEQFCFQDID